METDGVLSPNELKLAIRALGKVGDVELTKQMLDKFLKIDEVPPDQLGAIHGAVLRTLCANGLHDDAVAYFNDHHEELNEVHATILFKGLKGPRPNDECIRKALDIATVVTNVQTFDVISYASLFSLCGMASTDAAADVLHRAMGIFERATSEGAMTSERVVYNSLSLLAAKAKDTQTVEKLMAKMKEHGLDPSPSTYSSLLVGSAHAGNHKDAVQIAKQLLTAEGCLMDNAVMHAFLQSCKAVGENQLVSVRDHVP